MSKAPLAIPKNLFLKALVLSLLFHLIFINLFIFVLPAREASHKPNLIFLGPILRGNNALRNNFYKAQVKTPSDDRSLIKIDATEKEGNPYQFNGQKKPFAETNKIDNEKVEVKSVFFEREPSMDEPTRKPEIIDTLDQIFKSERYERLHLP